LQAVGQFDTSSVRVNKGVDGPLKVLGPHGHGVEGHLVPLPLVLPTLESTEVNTDVAGALFM
jgi:hypothetical protein